MSSLKNNEQFALELMLNIEFINILWYNNPRLLLYNAVITYRRYFMTSALDYFN